MSSTTSNHNTVLYTRPLFGFYKRMLRDGDGVIPPVVHEQKVIFQGIDYHIRMTSRIIRRKIIKCWRQCWSQGY